MTVTQAIYSLLYNFVPSPLYNDWLMMGFATFFTNFSVLSLFFDEFISSVTVMAFPELYRKCQKGRYLSPKTFIGWTILAVYQGSVILFMSLYLFPVHGVESRHLQSTAFTSLVLTELGLIALEINHFNIVSIGAEACSLVIYFIAMLVLRDAFDLRYIFGWSFAWKIAVVTTLCIAPLAVFKFLNRVYAPSHEERLMPGSHMGQSPAGQFVIL
jgi:phospholipid-translocating ATPase